MRERKPSGRQQATPLTRRNFITGASVIAGGVAAASMMQAKTAYADETGAAATEATPEALAAEAAAEETKVFDGVELSMGRILHDPDVCAGCRICEIVCSLNKWGTVNSELSMVKIQTDYLGGYISRAEMCKQCAGPECVAICPNDACHVDPTTGARVIDQTKCVGCQLCRYSCPLEPSRVVYNASKSVCRKCDFCDGEPMCIAYCPAHALSLSWAEQADGALVVETASGIKVSVDISGAVVVISKDSVEVLGINAVVGTGSVTVGGAISSTYSQPFTAKIKTSYFDFEGELLYFSERLEIDVHSNTTEPFEDTFETAEPERVATCRLEIMCGKIAG